MSRRPVGALLDEARELPEEERERFAMELLRTLPARVGRHFEYTAEWLEEIEERANEVVRGEVELEDWADVCERARRPK